MPRSTQDADFVIQLGHTPVSALAKRLGGEFRLEPQMSFETVTATRRWELLLRDSPFKIELFLLGDDEHDQARFERRRQVETLGRTIWLPTAEDVIITKLRWSRQGRRPKDLEDARNVIAVQARHLDWHHVRHWCGVHGTGDLLDRLRRSIPGCEEDS